MREASTRRFIRSAIIALSLVPAILRADPFQEAYEKGMSRYGTGDYGSALPSFMEAAESKDSGVAAAASANAGYCLSALGEHSKAIAWYERALGHVPDYLPALEGLSLSCFADRNTYEKGYRYATKAEALFSSNPNVYYNLACYFATGGDAAAALKYVDAALFYGFHDIGFISADADLSLVRGKEPFKTFLAKTTSMERALALAIEAWASQEKGNHEDATPLLEQAIEACRPALGEESLFECDLVSSMALSFFHEKQYAPALDAWKRALAIHQKRQGRLHPITANFSFNAGNALFGLARYDEAISSYLESASIRTKISGEGSPELRAIHAMIGESYSASGEHAQAAEFFKRSIPSAAKGPSGGFQEKVGAEFKLGNALLAGGERDEAVAAFERALEAQAAALGADHPDVAAACVSLGVEFLNLGDFERAEGFFNRALDIQRKASGEDGPETLSTREYLADILYARSEFAEAMERYRRNLEAIERSSGESSLQAAYCRQRMGAALYSLGDYEGSRTQYETARGIFLSIAGKDSPDAARCLLGSGAILYTRGLYDDAIAAYSEALPALLSSYGEKSLDVAKDYLGLGLSHFSKGDFSKSIAYYERAAAIQKSLLGESSVDLSRSYMNLSAAYSAMGDTGNAITYINTCFDIQERVFGPEHLDVSVVQKMAGGIYQSMGNFDEALSRYRSALDIQMKILGSEHQQVAETKNNMGTLFFGRGMYDEAIRMYEEAARIKEKVFGKENAFLALDYLNLGSVYGKKGETSKSLGLMREALALSKKFPDRRLVLEIAENLGETYLDLKKYAEAEKALASGMDLVEKSRQGIGTAKTEILARNSSLYYLSMKASAARRDLAKVFAVSEAMKARGYLDGLSLAGALGAEGVPEKDRARMLELNEKIDVLARWQWSEIGKPAELQDKKSLLRVASESKTLESEFETIERSLMANPRFRELRRPAIARLKDAQKTLGPGQAFLDYIINPEGSHRYAWCLVIKRDSAALVELEAAFDFTKAVSDLRESIRDRSETRHALSSRLHEALIRPLKPALSGVERLIIVPEGSLALLPFDALRENGNSPYLCQSYEISLVPSVSVLLMTDGRSYGERTGSWLGVGGVLYDEAPGPARDEGRGITVTAPATEKTKAYYAAQGQEAYFGARGFQWKNLPGTKQEVEGIAKEAFGGKRVQLLLGDRASEKALKGLSESGELSRQRIVHFACHAYFDSEYPQYSSLVLAEAGEAAEGDSDETGYLTVEDVALLRFKADLVALSACETGRGAGLPGDGVVGFARSLLVAGVNRAELTLWPIDDEATRDFMMRWYALIETEGMDFAKAMARVKREFIKSRAYSDPLYWSAFVLYGR